MKNNILLWAILAVIFGFTAEKTVAQTSPTASKVIYNWDPFEDSKMLKLFYNALKAGRNFPTDEEFKAAFGVDVEFARSHVRPATLLIDQQKQLNPTLNPHRKLWMNLPSGVGKMIGGYPSSMFINDVYSMWQYTHLFGSWNHGLFQAPGAFADAAHKHGTGIFSGIKFFESWTPGSGDGAYTKLITEKEGGKFKYAEALVNCLMYLGLDGINYNWEDGSYSNPEVIAFHKECFRLAKEKGFDSFRIGLYTQSSQLSSYNASALYYGSDPQEKTIDLMLNYSGGDFSSAFANSIATAKSVAGHTNNLYSGVWIVTMDRKWRMMNSAGAREMNLCLWGEHGQSRFMSYNAGKDGYDIQENYQKLLERTFSGGKRNPADLPALSDKGNNWEQDGGKEPLSTFGGLATMIAERTTLQGKLPFITNFQLGNGDRYNYKGKKTFGAWYNMGAQDYQPTYRWLVYQAGSKTVSNNIQPSYTHRDAYNGGSTLQLKGTATTAGTDIVLFRGDLEISAANPKLHVAVKTYKEGTTPTNLYVILKKKDNDTWFEFPVGNTSGKLWEEKTLNMEGFALNEHIEYIGLRVKALADNPNYHIYVGKLGLTDDRIVNPAEVENLVVEVKEETQKSMSLKLNWKVRPFTLSERAKNFGLVYNDEANVDHFEIVYKNGENGRIKAIARTSAWSNFVGDIFFEDKAGAKDEPYIGVRAVSVDGKSYSKVNWVKVARAEEGKLPEAGDSRYCKSELYADSEGADIARVQRYLTVVKTTGLTDNLNYTANAPVADGTNYVDATNHSFTAAQGQKFDFFFKAFDSTNSKWPNKNGILEPKIDGLRWCFAKAYIDWDNNGDFDTATETVFGLGTIRKGTPEFETTGITQSFTVPEKANPGKTRMRIVFSDAWFTHPGPCGVTQKGFSIDFSVNITGTNEPLIAEDKHDQGIADEPDAIHEDPTGLGETEASQGAYSFFYPNPSKDIIFFENVQQVWIYALDGRLVYSDKGKSLSQADVSALSPGLYTVRMLYNNVIRSRKLLKE